MDKDRLRRLLDGIKSGKLQVDAAMEELKHLPFEDLGFAKVDHHRDVRSSIPEVVYAKDKKPEEVIAIAAAMRRKSGRFLITKASQEIYAGLKIKEARFYPDSRLISCGEAKKKRGFALVVSAGTSDIPVAEEAAVTASFLGSRTELLCDIGVAGIHRLFGNRDKLAKACVIVVVAGMEGALPSVIGGITDRPVIAVPTSVGYGTSFGGLTALFAMLNSCVPGIAVMNIDNGFGAGCLAHKINFLK